MSIHRGQWIAAVGLWLVAAALAQAAGEAAPTPAVVLNAPTPELPATPPPADASSAVPAATAATQPVNVEQQLLGGHPNGPREGDRLKSGDASSSSSGWIRTVLSLAVVLGLIFALKWAMRKYSPGKAAPAQSKLVEVLFRTPISPKHQVMLIRVGQRVLVVGAGAEGMNTLAEISDPEQVAEVLGAAERSKSTSLSGNFSQLMRNWRGQLDERPAAPEELSSSPAGKALVQVRTLLDQLRVGKGKEGGER